MCPKPSKAWCQRRCVRRSFSQTAAAPARLCGTSPTNCVTSALAAIPPAAQAKPWAASPRLGLFIDESEIDVLAHMDFPAQHRTKVHSTNPIERLNKEVKRRADVVGIFPNEGSIIGLIGAVLLEANDEWQTQHRYMQTEAMAELTPSIIDVMPDQITTVAA